MRFVNHTTDKQQQNLEAFVHEGQLFYRTVKDIPPNMELLITYTDTYEEFSVEYELPANEITEIADGDYVNTAPYNCLDCQVAYSSDIVYHKHMRSKHNKPIPLDVYLKIQREGGIIVEPIVVQPKVSGDSDEEAGWFFDAETDAMASLESGKMTRKRKQKASLTEEDQKQKENARGKKRKNNLIKDNLTYSCSVCDRQFKSRACLIQHEDVHVEDKPYQCPKCGKRFVREKAYEGHMERHNEIRPHQCSACGRGFLKPKDLKVHMRRHTGERPYKCETCGKTFMDVGNLDRHKRLHTGEKPYKCSTCGKTFAQSGHLREHIKNHTGDKAFKCDKCGAAFTNRSNLQTHNRVHTKEKPFMCRVCGKSYRDATYLKTHMRLHTGEKPYVCMDCGMAFSANSKMRFHRRKVHQAGYIRPPKVRTEIVNVTICSNDLENSDPAII